MVADALLMPGAVSGGVPVCFDRRAREATLKGMLFFFVYGGVLQAGRKQAGG